MQFCRTQSHYGGEQVAIDSSKFSADNSRSKVTRKKDLLRERARLEAKISVWLDVLEANDDDDQPPSSGDTQPALKAERDTLTERIKSMDDAGISAQPETDPEARVMRRGHIGCNVQSTVDSKHRLISDVDVVQGASDVKQLYRMARRTQVQLQSDTLEVLADAGRPSMVEHPFGTLKRRMDGGRFLVRGLHKVKAEMALAMTAYNITRAINVLGAKRLCQALAT